MRKLPLTIASLAVLAGTIATAGAASASTNPVQQPVSASVTVNEVLSVQGFSPTVTFQNAVPGQTADALAAQTFSVVTNHGSGATLSIKNENGGFHTAIGQPDQIRNDALVIGSTRLVNDGVTFLGTIPVGDHSYIQDWHLDISPTANGSLNAQYTLSVIAN